MTALFALPDSVFTVVAMLVVAAVVALVAWALHLMQAANDRHANGYRMAHVFSQEGNTIVVWERTG